MLERKGTFCQENLEKMCQKIAASFCLPSVSGKSSALGEWKIIRTRLNKAIRACLLI